MVQYRRRGPAWIAPLSVGTALSLSLITSKPQATAQPQSGELPLGRPNLQETRTGDAISPGVTYTRIVRGQVFERDFYTVDVAFQAESSAAQAIAQKLRAEGYGPGVRVEPIPERAPDDPERGPLGYLVRVGRFATEAEANALRDRLAADGYTGLRVVYTGEDGERTTGPWVVHVLEIVPRQFQGKIIPELATDIVPERETLTSISARNRSLAGINGGYFVINPTDGTPGDLAGISIVDGALISEAIDGRTNFILPTTSGEGALVGQLSTRQIAIAGDGARLLVDGLNRKPGLIRNCGGDGGDQPTEQPKHDFTCTDPSELILFTPAFGQRTEPGEGLEAVLDAAGTVTELRSRGGPIPADGSVLAGTAEAAAWLQAHARPGEQVTVDTQLLANGQPLSVATPQGVVNGGPRLLQNGQISITAFAEGFQRPEDPEFYYRFGRRRNPRTLAGVTADGRIILVAVDGRQPGYSVGASFEESARILQALGAVDGVNLDGGGSTTLTIGPRLVNRPSDPTGERPIGDAILIQP